MERWKLPMLSINFLTLQIKLPENCSLKNEFITFATAISLRPDNLILMLSHTYLLVPDGSTLLCPTVAWGWPCRNGGVQNKKSFFYFLIWPLLESRSVVFGRDFLTMGNSTIYEMPKVWLSLLLRQKKVSDIWLARLLNQIEPHHCRHETSLYHTKNNKKILCILLQRIGKCLKHNNVLGNSSSGICSITITAIKVW